MVARVCVCTPWSALLIRGYILEPAGTPVSIIIRLIHISTHHRDRFIFGSCCKLPQPQVEPVVAVDEWGDQVNSLPLDQVDTIRERKIVIVKIQTRTVRLNFQSLF